MPKKIINKVVEKKASRKPRNFTRLRGMKDILFEEHKYWDLVERKTRDLARIYGFNRISTPILEKLDMYERSTGKETDIVSKEMYSFVDKSGDKVALRPEATPGLVRAYIEHGMFNHPQPVKMFWFGPCFRHDKPQSGRYRQFTQFDLEMYGEEGPVADSQLILIAYNFFSELQINVQVQINSIGCRDCRVAYIKKLTEFYKERGKRSRLCNDCKKRFLKNPLRLLDCKEETCREIREDAPQIVDFLCDSCREHFIKVLEYLDDLEVPYALNPFLVRGLDYYNRTVFEVVALDEEKSFENKTEEVVEASVESEVEVSEEEVEENEPGNVSGRKLLSLGGGGRYDGLVEYMGGRPTPACGFGIGIERVIMKIKEKNIPLKAEDENILFLAQLGDQAKRKIFALFEEMRRSGYHVRQAFTKNSLKAQLEEANRLNAKYCLILGQKELMDETILIRDMESGTQEVVDFKKIYTEIDKRLKNN